MVSTVSPKAKLTPRNPMPSDGKPAASTALPQPANVSQKVPKNSAPRRRHMTMFLPRGSCLPSHFFMSELGHKQTCRDVRPMSALPPKPDSPCPKSANIGNRPTSFDNLVGSL